MSGTANNEQQSATRATAGNGSTKKLSNAIMGMQFMQRKAEASKLAKRQNDQRKSFSQATGSDRRKSVDQSKISIDIKSEGDPATLESVNEMIVPEIATAVDMYGVGADVIGRRSFGGFHNVIRDTWNSALKIRTDDDARTRATKSHITDEELLQRYEKYVKGRGAEKADSRMRREKRKRS